MSNKHEAAFHGAEEAPEPLVVDETYGEAPEALPEPQGASESPQEATARLSLDGPFYLGSYEFQTPQGDTLVVTRVADVHVRAEDVTSIVSHAARNGVVLKVSK